MPWTFAHPAAVLPLRRLAPKYLNLPALVCGALAPDAGYYFGRFDIASFAHTAVGSVLAGVPIGLLGLLLFHAIREPLWFLLPQPHRSAMEPLLRPSPPRGFVFLLIAALSVLVGVWTHNVWDSFTHDDGWIVSRVPALRNPMLSLGLQDFLIYNVLQHLSTVGGVAVLLVSYRAWLRRQPKLESERGGDRMRYVSVFGAAAVSLAIAMVLAHRVSLAYTGETAFRQFVVQTAIQGVTVLAAMALLYSAIYAVRKRIA